MSVSTGREVVLRFIYHGRQNAIRKTILVLVALISTTFLLSSCSSIPAPSSSSPSTVKTATVSVQISPSNALIAQSGTLQFSAAISGTSDVGVVWAAKGGTISSDGLFTGSNSDSTATITATSVANPAASASASVTFSVPSKLAIVSSVLPAATTGVPYSASMQSSGGTPPYNWSVASGSLPQGFTMTTNGIVTGTPIQVGSFPVTLKVSDSASQSTTAALSFQVTAGSTLNYTGFDGPAELPRVYMHTALADTPAPGSTISVNAGGDLQSALNSANCGDTILLQAGATFSGNFQIPAKSCDDQHWIIVRTSSLDSALPPEGTRMNPCYAGVSSLPGRPAFSCPAVKNVLAKILFTTTGTYGPVQLLQGATHYRFIGLEITRALPQVHLLDLVATKDDTGSADHLIFDRVWFHGTASDETKGGVHLTGISYAAVVDSYFSDFHCISLHGSCTDSEAINGGGGSVQAGPFKINNNFLEAAGQSIMFGGATGSTSPTDIEIRYNHLFKPLTWQPGAVGFVGAYTGDPYIVKNHFELKNAQRVLLEGNILENVWGGFTQHGFSVVLTPATQGGICVPCQVTDVTIRYNEITNVGGGFDIGNVEGATGGFAVAGERYSIHDVLLENLNATQYNGYGTLVMMLSYSSSEVLNHVSMQHITAFPDLSTHIMSVEDTVAPMPGFVFANNLVQSPRAPTQSAGGGSTNCAASDVPTTVIQTCFPGYVFAGNVLVGDFTKYLTTQWPSGQTFLASFDQVGFVNYAAGDYALSSSSPYKEKGTDGKDVGADIAGLNSAINGVQ